jgi:hypothetical protein
LSISIPARKRLKLWSGRSPPRFQLYRQGQTIFDGFHTITVAFTLTGLGDPFYRSSVQGNRNYFESSRLPLIRGQFLPGEGIAMPISEHFWKSRLVASKCPGAQHPLDGVAHIVGVISIGNGSDRTNEVTGRRAVRYSGFSQERMMQAAFLRTVED